MRIPQIKDIIPLENGIFSHMVYTFKADVTKEQLDYLLLANIGRRNPAPVIDLLHDEPDEELTDAQLTKLASLLLNYYKPKWDKLGDVYDIEYDPIHNYLDQWEDESDAEDENTRTLDSDRNDTLGTTVQHSNTRTDNLTELETRNLGSSNTRTDNLTELETRNLGSSNTRTDNTQTENTGTQQNAGTSSDTDSRWGFNSTNAVNTDSNSGNTSNTRTDNLVETHTGTVGNTGTETGTVQTTNTGTQSSSGTETGTRSIGNTGTQQNVGSDATTGTNSREVDETETNAGTNHRERTGRHFGNIGNLTSQKQIQEEIELWKWNYIESILEDAKNFLTLLVYC